MDRLELAVGIFKISLWLNTPLRVLDPALTVLCTSASQRMDPPLNLSCSSLIGHRLLLLLYWLAAEAAVNCGF